MADIKKRIVFRPWESRFDNSLFNKKRAENFSSPFFIEENQNPKQLFRLEILNCK
jgi:hypothetical protein